MACNGTETNCSDGIDNDHDTLLDCLDPNCFNNASCANAAVEIICNDGLDNDSDGSIDCIDTDCSPTPLCNGH